MENKKLEDLKTDEEIIEFIKNKTSNSSDMYFRKVDVLGNTVNVVYNEATASTNLVSDFVIRSLEDISNLDKVNNKLSSIENILGEVPANESKVEKKEKLYKKLKYDLDVLKERDLIGLMEDSLSICKVEKLDLKEDNIFYYLYSGFTLIIYNLEILAVETKENLDRTITEPVTEVAVRGPKDGFVENFQKNVGLIRKRIKDENLVLNEKKIGRRSKTKIGLMYIKDIAKPEFIKYIENKLKGIDIDAIIDSNYIVELIEDSKKTDFPVTLVTERPDVASFYLLQGRAVIVVENTPFAIVVPVFMEDFIKNIDDYYQKDSNIFITKIIRYIAFIITLFTPALYIALITFDQEAIPTELLISFATQREGVPFPAAIEALLMIGAFEILRESDYRVPNVAGNTLSIVGALILGDAAVSAGIVSPIMIIVVAITTISGMMFTDINMVNAVRKWRIIHLFFASIAGLFGFGISVLMFITKLSSIDSFTKPYTYPISPFDFTQIGERILRRKNIADDTKRQKILTNNLTKYNKSGEQIEK